MYKEDFNIPFTVKSSASSLPGPLKLMLPTFYSQLTHCDDNFGESNINTSYLKLRLAITNENLTALPKNSRLRCLGC